MSYADVVNQMQAIQSMLGLLRSTPSAAATKASSANATTFATALDSASAVSDSNATTSATSAAATSGISTSATASTDGTLVSPNGVTGNDVVDAALDYQGTPYLLGGESKSGIDCSGLVQAAFAKEGVSVPRLVHEQETVGQKVDSLKDAKPGDLIVLNGGDHIAIYMGNDTVIHAPYAGRTVSVQKAWFTDKDITTIRRIVPAGDGTGTDATTAASTTASGILGGSSLSTASGLSQSTIQKATAMLTTYGADVGLYSASDSSTSSDSSGGTSLSSLLASFGLTGTSSGSSTTSSTSAAQQIIAARQALLGATT